MLSVKHLLVPVTLSLLVACTTSPPPVQPSSARGTPEPAASADVVSPTPSAPVAAPNDAGSEGEGTTGEGGAAPADAGPSASTEPAEPEPPPELPKGTTILHIGDSFAGALGIDLNRELDEHGVRGVLKYETSTYIPTWAWSKDLNKYLWTYHPDLVLITLGANELQHPHPEERAKTIHKLVGRLGGRPCVWIAPPLWEGARDALLEVIRDNCAPCLYMDSNALVPDLPRARDHIHPSTQARKRWAKVVVDWLARHRDPKGDKPWALEASPTP